MKLRPRSQRRTRLRLPILKTALLLSPRGKEEKEKPLQLLIKVSLQKPERNGPRR